MYQISVNLENFRFWDQICPKNVSDKNFEKMNMKFEIRIQQCTPVLNFSQPGELQFLRLNLPKKDLRVGGVTGQTQPENNLF